MESRFSISTPQWTDGVVFSRSFVVPYSYNVGLAGIVRFSLVVASSYDKAKDCSKLGLSSFIAQISRARVVKKRGRAVEKITVTEL